jgi:hypothetical protein
MGFHVPKAAIADRFSVADDGVVKGDAVQLVAMLEPDDPKSSVYRLVLPRAVVEGNEQVLAIK